MKNKERLSGVFVPMVTPFRDDEIFFEGLIENIQKLNETGLKGYFVLGTNGEFKSLSVEERIKILETVVEYAADDKIVMAGTAEESTKETIDISLEAAKIGVSQISLLMPHFFRKYIDDDVLINYIVEVADASPVPVVLYNNPSVAAGLLISKGVVKAVSDHLNVIGMKDSSRGNYKDYITAANEDFYLMAGSASFFFEALQAGAVGGVLSLANVFPEECVKLYTLYTENKMVKAEEQNKKIIDLNKKVSGFGGVAAVKGAMDLVGYNGGSPRRPLKSLTEEEKKTLKENVMEYGFIRG